MTDPTPATVTFTVTVSVSANTSEELDRAAAKVESLLYAGYRIVGAFYDDRSLMVFDVEVNFGPDAADYIHDQVFAQRDVLFAGGVVPSYPGVSAWHNAPVRPSVVPSAPRARQQRGSFFGWVVAGAVLGHVLSGGGRNRGMTVSEYYGTVIRPAQYEDPNAVHVVIDRPW